MARPQKWQNKKERREAQNARRKSERSNKGTEFIAVDGEGTSNGANHRYVLLGVAAHSVENTDGLTTQEIFQFLYERYRAHPDAAFVGFFLNYDFTQWLKGLPEKQGWLLFDERGIKLRQRRVNPAAGPFPVRWEGWEFDILGSKRFKLRPEGVKGKWLSVCDAGPFFQASLMSVIDPGKWDVPVVTDEEYALLEEGKKNRDHAVLDADMRKYNALENNVLVRLMERVDAGLRKAGIRLRKDQWFGPGQAAQEWLRLAGVPSGEMVYQAIASHGTTRILEGASGKEIRSGFDGGSAGHVHQGRQQDSAVVLGGTGLSDAGRMSYYGGWFEIFAHGIIPGRSWEYDINSAYPAIASVLPCLLHGDWTYRGEDVWNEERAVFTLVHARVAGSNRRIGAMLHRRNDGTILRPLRTGGWYWQSELSAAWKCGLIDEVQIDESWEYEPCGCACPLSGLSGLYDRRLRAGKNSPEGKGLKLVYNSVYGKFAQSIGEPRFANSFYASRITSGTREMILDAIRTHPGGTDAVVMVATDGVYFRSRHPGLRLGVALGEWEEAEHEDLTLFKPGVYWDNAARKRIRDGNAPGFKARGISARQFAGEIKTIDDSFRHWPERYPVERDPDGPREGWFPKVTFRSGFSMVSCKQALRRGKWELAGRVSDDQELVQDADPVGKRHSGYYEGGVYWSKPFQDGGSELESVPYDKRFGQPDPDEYGINEDGTVKDQWGDLMRLSGSLQRMALRGMPYG